MVKRHARVNVSPAIRKGTRISPERHLAVSGRRTIPLRYPRDPTVPGLAREIPQLMFGVSPLMQTRVAQTVDNKRAKCQMLRLEFVRRSPPVTTPWRTAGCKAETNADCSNPAYHSSFLNSRKGYKSIETKDASGCKGRVT
jgi:hypothetical protein